MSAPPPSPAELPALETAVAADPGDGDLVLLLAAGYRAADRGTDAIPVVREARSRDPGNAELVLMEGVLLEDAGQWAEARAAYTSYLEMKPGGELAGEAERRRDLVRLEELKSDVREALAQEARFAERTPPPGSVGMFPFAYEGDDERWEPLRHALAELLVTDLAITGRLTVVERVRIRTLVDELALGASGLVDPATAARSGRLLSAAQVVQGRFRVEGETLDVDLAVVPAASAVPAVRPLTAQGPLERLLQLERDLALDLHTALGIQLTPAERQRIGEGHTANIQALLEFGRGLEALDAGRFEEAQTHFGEATRLDPGFSLASRRLATARAGIQAGAGRARLQGGAAAAARRRQAVRALRTAPAAVRQRILRQLDQRRRAALVEALGQDRLGTAILLELVFRPPGGGP